MELWSCAPQNWVSVKKNAKKKKCTDLWYIAMAEVARVSQEQNQRKV